MLLEDELDELTSVEKDLKSLYVHRQDDNFVSGLGWRLRHSKSPSVCTGVISRQTAKCDCSNPHGMRRVCGCLA